MPNPASKLPKHIIDTIETYGRACFQEGAEAAELEIQADIEGMKPLAFRFKTVREMLENFVVPTMTRNALQNGGCLDKTLQQLHIAAQNKTLVREPCLGLKSYRLIVSMLEASRLDRKTNEQLLEILMADCLDCLNGERPDGMTTDDARQNVIERLTRYLRHEDLE